MFRQIPKSANSIVESMVVIMVVLLVGSCTNVDENIVAEVTSSQFFKTEEEFISALGDAYRPLGNQVSFSCGVGNSNITTDEIIVGQKGQNWGVGHWTRYHKHEWLINDRGPEDGWQDLFSGVNNTNRIIFQFESQVESGNINQDDAANFIAELKVLRAYYYYQLLDLYGNVPIIRSFAEAEENPSQPSDDFQQGRRAVFDFVESSVLENINQLSTDAQSTYGRVNKWVAHMLLAKLYLNAKVFTGEERWSDVISHTDAIINSGEYNMATNYRDNFKVDNSESPEMIFAIPYDKVFYKGFDLHLVTLHYSGQIQFNLQDQPYNGFATMEEFYKSYIDPNQNPGPQGEVWGLKMTSTEQGLERIQGTQDDRLVNFLVGPQFGPNGNRLMDPSVEEFDPNGPPVTYTPEINELQPNYLRQAGARIGKYEIEMGINQSMSNDVPIFRYTDVLLTKAEALWRMNNSDPEALRLINKVRQRAGVYDFNNLDADKILAERGREMFYEFTRRQDLIRFDGVNGGETRYNDPWKYKDISPSYRNVYPIPFSQMNVNPNIVQNPGY